MACRVLLVHPYRYVCGPDTFVINIVRCLRAEGYTFWVALGAERPLGDTLRGLGAEVVVLPGLQTLPRTLSPVQIACYIKETKRSVAALRQLAWRAAVNVVHATHETMWPALIGVRRVGVGCVVSVHGLRFASPRWAGWLNTRLLDWRADRIICVSEAVRQIFRHWRVPECKLALVPNSVDLDRFSQQVSGEAFRREIGVEPGTPLVGTVGSVDERKGQLYFVEACRLLRDEFPVARFVIVGDPGLDAPLTQANYARRLRARATELGLDGSLRLLSPRSDIPQVMAALDILVQPSLTEAAPLAPLEAMAIGRPVVGTRVGGTVEEVVDGETGILVEPADSVVLAQAIGELLRDPERRQKMGRAGRARVERFYSLERTAESINDVHLQAAALPRTG